MLINSMAGDFKISIRGFEVEGGRLVMVGTMGVWDARTYFSPREVVGVLAKLMRPTVFLYLLRLPLLLLRGEPKEPSSPREDDR